MAEQAPANLHPHPNYVKTWGVLVVLLVISVLGPLIGIKAVTIVTAFGIAIVKAYLVAKNFMHVNVEPKFVTYLLLTTLAFLALLFFFVAPDVMRHDGQNWVNYSAQESVAAVEDADTPPFDANQTFATVCASCHGPTGAGDGPAAASMTVKPAAFNRPDFWAGKTKADLMKVIELGGAATGKSPLMAPYGGVYKPDQIGELADLIMGFRPASDRGPAKPPKPKTGPPNNAPL